MGQPPDLRPAPATDGVAVPGDPVAAPQPLGAPGSAPPAVEESPAASGEIRHNLLALGGDFALWMIGLSFASQSTILPAFAEKLGAPNMVIGAIPAVMTLGWFLPSLFVAGHTETLRHRLPFVLRYTVWERVPFLLLALLAFFLAERAPRLSLAALLAILLVISTTGGVLMPAWMDIVGRAIPTRLRGRFFGVTSLVASVGGLLGSSLTAWILAVVPGMPAYGWLFLLATLFMGLSFTALVTVREPPAPMAVAERSLGRYLRGIPSLLAGDRNFSWFLVARSCAAVGTMAGGFHTVYALQTLEAQSWWVGVFTMVLFAGQVVGNLGLGWLADHAGHRLVIMVGALALAAANVTAYAATSVEVFAAVFALAGLNQAAVYVSNLNVLLEFAPSPEARPTYVGVGLSTVGPVLFVAPFIAGLMADGIGLPWVFALAAVGSVLGFALLATRVKDPRGNAAGEARLAPPAGPGASSAS